MGPRAHPTPQGRLTLGAIETTFGVIHMRVAIIAPPYPLEEAPAPPLGVTYVAAAFEQAGADVRIFDYLVSGYTPEKMRTQMDEFQPDVIGSTSVTLNFPGAAEIVSTAKRYRPSLVTMMGGPHVSFAAAETLDTFPGIDLIVRGEGEETIAELVSEEMGPSAWEKIRGLAFRRNGEIVMTEPRPFIEDLDALPLPARHLLPLSRYQALGYSVSIITSRGCPYSCIFCLGRRMVGNRVRLRSASRVVDEIEQILAYGIDRINVADDLFVSHSGRVREVCDEILRRGLRFSWSAFARVNTVDRETLKLMREAGCDSVSFGVETGNAGLLKVIRKGITREQVREAVSLCRETGIIPHTSFIVGLPGETPETLEETGEFAASLGSLYGYHFLAPFPGTTVREEVEKYDLEILSDDWTRYDANSAIVRTSRLTPEEMDRFVARFESTIGAAWQEMIRGYQEKRNPPGIDLQVEGHFRMKLVYRLLSEDLIEKMGAFPHPGNADGCSEGAFEDLCRRIATVTGEKGELIRKTLRSLIDSGYIKAEIKEGLSRWYWTHNRHFDCLSLTPKSTPNMAPAPL
ncbi:MAG TPA: B12-binding domain-containing radical SAM protein [Syntrophus sp. (in: bacteria)]|nr:B12-binding domain-containing radical SAM protein [Syntrophus sp. (in: bacteria)]